MKPLLPALLLSVAATSPLPALAGPKADALTACVSDATSGKDRKDLARWVFIAMSSHPEIRPLSNVPEQARDEADASMARLLTTLLAERCTVQAREAVQEGGSVGMLTAFQTLGGLAMKELMSHPDVASSMSGFERRIDRAKLDAAMSGR